MTGFHHELSQTMRVDIDREPCVICSRVIGAHTADEVKTCGDAIAVKEMRTATPYKLRNGQWGARVAESATKGDIEELRVNAKKNGKTWTGWYECRYTGDGWSIWTVHDLRGRMRAHIAGPGGW